MKKVGFMFITMLLAAMLLAACGGNQQNTSDVSQNNESTGGQVTDANNPQEPVRQQNSGEDSEIRTVTHALGTTDIEGTPQQVVTLFQGATDAALALGVKPVAAVESWIEQPWYEYIRDQMDGVVNLGDENQPDLEKIAELKPDVIIASKTRHEKISEQLSAIAPTVMTEEVYFWRDTLQLTAEALNKQAEEESFLQQWEQKVADFKQQMGDRLNEIEVAVIDFRTDHVRIVYTGFAALVLDELGVPRPNNQKGESWGVKLTTKENIPQMNADILFDQTSTSRDDGRLDLRASWMEHPLWQNLRAVQNNKVYEVDTAVWNNGSGPLAAMLMLEDLYQYLELEQ